jgi:hypothetical protein
MIPKSMSSTPIGDGNRFSDKIMLKDAITTPSPDRAETCIAHRAHFAMVAPMAEED